MFGAAHWGYQDAVTRPDHILVVDDDLEIRSLLRDYLARHGYRVTPVPDGSAMWSQIERSRIDLIILDVMLPGEDGLSICRNLRARQNIPVIMLTALGETTDRIVGLEMGADDYLAKPFEPRELLARIKVVLRRTRALPGPEDKPEARHMGFAGWTLDTTARHLVSPEGIVVTLSLNRPLTMDNSPGIFGLGVLAGLALMVSAAAQGSACAASIGASKSRPEIFGISIAPAAVVEGFAVFAFVFALVLAGGIPA